MNIKFLPFFEQPLFICLFLRMYCRKLICFYVWYIESFDYIKFWSLHEYYYIVTT